MNQETTFTNLKKSSPREKYACAAINQFIMIYKLLAADKNQTDNVASKVNKKTLKIY